MIIRYPDTFGELRSVGPGLTYTLTVANGYRVYQFTAGTGTIII